jgi:transcriptional regulator with XRE-family HTH domain
MGRIDFGYVLRKLRHSRGETLEQVSEATGLSAAMLSRVERGERLPSPESVEVLARHFDLPVDYLMSETIAHRMVNRYGEESTNRVAEHLSRDSTELGLFADLDAGGEVAQTGIRPELDSSLPTVSQRLTRAYGPFEQMDVLAALGGRERRPGEPPAASPTVAAPPTTAAPPPAASPPTPAQEANQTPPAQERFGFMLGGATPGTSRSEIDPVTQSVLRAAVQASEAAVALVRREAPSLSSAARLELIDRVDSLAGQAVDVLRMLSFDPDRRVRAAARDALKRLGGA